jgi:hypothetical protein
MRLLLFTAATAICFLTGCRNAKVSTDNDIISPYLFGQNLWLTDGSEGRPGYIDKFLWPKIKESGIKIIRIGGNGYDGSMPGIETLTKWIREIKAIGAEPLLQVSRHEPAQKAADLVRYFNIDHDYKIKFWAISNEPYLIAHVPIDTVSKYIKSYASAMKAVDPSIKIFVPDEAAYVKELYEALLLDDSKSVAGRDINGNWYIDGVTFHNYPNGKNYNRSDVIFYSVSKMRGMIINLKEVIEKANKKYNRTGNDELLWGLTEFNITYDNPDDLSTSGIAVPSFINGQFFADVFGLAMEYGAFCVTPWCIQESDRPSTYFGYIGAPPGFIPHSTFYHMKIMAENMNGAYLKINSGNPFVKIHGSKSNNNTVILIMNQHQDKSFDFDLSNIYKESETDGKLRIISANQFQANYSGTIKPNSSLMLLFSNNGKLKKQILYDSEMAGKNEAPAIKNAE